MKNSSSHEKYAAYTATKILQCFYLSLVPVSILLLAVIFPLAGFVYSVDSASVVVVESYIVVFIAMLIGYKWPKWFPWHFWYPTEYYGIFLSHIFRLTVFVLPIASGFLAGILGASWAAIIPLLAFGVIGLIVTFPTKNKVDKWIKEQAPKR